jgi:hypothetical protein
MNEPLPPLLDNFINFVADSSGTSVKLTDGALLLSRENSAYYSQPIRWEDIDIVGGIPYAHEAISMEYRRGADPILDPARFRFYKDGVELMTINPTTGNVGIGKINSTDKLYVNGTTQINGNLSVSGASNTFVVGAASTSYSGEIFRTQNSDNTLAVRNTSTGSTARSVLRLENSGNSGEIAYTSSTATNVDLLLIKNNKAMGSIFFTAGTGFIQVRGGSSRLGLGLDAAYQLHLSTDSAAKPTSSLWTISSDERLKENIQPADLNLCYQNVKSLPLRRYRWRNEVYDDEQINGDRNRIGFIAQEYKSIFPKDVRVGEFKKIIKIENKDDGSSDDKEIPSAEASSSSVTLLDEYKTSYELKDCLSINTDQIVNTLFGAVQKLISKVEYLESKLIKAGLAQKSEIDDIKTDTDIPYVKKTT